MVTDRSVSYILGTGKLPCAVIFIEKKKTRTPTPTPTPTPVWTRPPPVPPVLLGTLKIRSL